MRLTRSLEERLVNLYRQTKVVGGLFRSLGQEADAVGSAFALDRGDFLSPLIRNLGSMLVKGAEPAEIIRQYMAKGDSPTRGRELNIHYGDLERGFIGQISEVGDVFNVFALTVLPTLYLLGSVTWAFEFEDQPYFAGFRDFSAALCARGLERAGYEATAATVELPPWSHRLHFTAVELARAFDDGDFRARLAPALVASMGGILCREHLVAPSADGSLSDLEALAGEPVDVVRQADEEDQAKPTNPARSMTLNGIARPRTFSASAQKMCPPSSGRNGNRFTIASESEMIARIPTTWATS